MYKLNPNFLKLDPDLAHIWALDLGGGGELFEVSASLLDPHHCLDGLESGRVPHEEPPVVHISVRLIQRVLCTKINRTRLW